MKLSDLIRKARGDAADLIVERSTHRETISAIRVACDAQNRDLNDAETGRVRRALSEIQRIELDPKMARLAELEAEQRADEEADALAQQRNPGAPSPSDTGSSFEQGAGGDRALVGVGAPGGFIRTADRQPAVVGRTERWADNAIVRERTNDRDEHIIGHHGSLGQLVRAMSTTAGSAVVPTVWSGDIIDRARNLSVVLRAGAQMVPMDAKTVNIGRLTGDPTAAFRTEGSTITASDPTFDNVTLDAKTMSALTIGSLEWFQDADNIDQIVTNAIAQQFALTLDQVGMYGSITSGAGSINLPTPPNPRGVLGALNANASDSVLGNGTNGTAQTAG